MSTIGSSNAISKLSDIVHIGILKTDSVLEKFSPTFGEYPEMFRTVLSLPGRQSLAFTTYDVEHFEYPADVNACDAFLITGSKKSVYDDEPWIHRLRDYVVTLHEARVKLIGICFGHQMVAHALGGRTAPAEVGWGVGVHTARVITRAPFMEPARDEIRLIVSHKDQVAELPPGAILLAKSEFCPYAAFQLGGHILTFQGHPEFCKDYSKALMEFREDILGQEKFSEGIRSLDSETDEGIVAAWILNFVDMKYE
jgi:GMP synthase-like glutamine amidotransferase